MKNLATARQLVLIIFPTDDLNMSFDIISLTSILFSRIHIVQPVSMQKQWSLCVLQRRLINLQVCIILKYLPTRCLFWFLYSKLRIFEVQWKLLNKATNIDYRLFQLYVSLCWWILWILQSMLNSSKMPKWRNMRSLNKRRPSKLSM